ncbi:hypothetical protein DFQ28_002503 [Apophysomyces sp. BC1034]|nr:hypothetical protein DFQ30_001234 [Apophysomyces sp. BC1015]KAG0175517.1 hypothetical protein DFQ29_007127 [Apophysomyces sp. BC1021]KAG0190091.1 hypothetical protein DFQ28_002503 [Apophysomyces sp. BC1034]
MADRTDAIFPRAGNGTQRPDNTVPHDVKLALEDELEQHTIVWSGDQGIAQTMPEAYVMSKMFSDAMGPSNLTPYFYKARRSVEKEDLTMSTLVTYDRFQVLSRLASHYKGPISAAVHVNDDQTKDEVLRSLHELYASNPDMHDYVDIHLVLDRFDRQFNLWRNVAKFFARTDYVMMLDVDFHLCTNFRESIRKPEIMDMLRSGKTALVVPAFEYVIQEDGKDASTFPTTKTDLMAQVDQGKLDMFHKSWVKGHGSTDYDHWYTTAEKYKVTDYDFSYEPYIIYKKEGTPWCDERFIGYGANKAACLYEIFLSGIDYWVLPNDFLIHQTHHYPEDTRRKERLYDNLISPSNPKSYYTHLLDVATNYEQWAEAASILDDLEGLDSWKRDPQSPDYDWELVQTRLHQLRRVRETNQCQNAMIFALRTSLARNLGDMGNPKLYSHSRVGTKALISSYIDEVVKQLNWIGDEEAEDELDLKAKHEFFMNIRQSFGRTALLLSGGGTLGLNHIGVIKCLHSARLLPRVISGASSGSIMAAMLCTKTEEEIPQMFDPLQIKLDVFERDGHPDTPLMRLHRLLTSGQLYDVEILRDALRINLGDITFQEAFNRTRWILNITVSSSTLYDMPRLLNYLTAPDVLIWSAVAVSCSVPIFYASSPLYAKDRNGNVVPWNPSGGEFLYAHGEDRSATPLYSERVSGMFTVYVKQLTELGIMSSVFYKMQAVMSQKYSGDITIIPEIGYADFLKVLSNPTQGIVADAIDRGERATWPKMSIIKNHLQIELTIDAIIYRLRLRQIQGIQHNEAEDRRPLLENRSTSQIHLTRLPEEAAEEEEDQTEDGSIVVRGTKSTPSPSGSSTTMTIKQTVERKSTKRGLSMTTA